MRDIARRKMYMSDYQRKNPEKFKSAKLKQLYGITLVEYNEMLVSQGGVCAICKTAPGKRSFHVDHKHVPGHAALSTEEKRRNVRGLLCTNCNTSIGSAREDVQILKRMVQYLETTPSPPASSLGTLVLAVK